MGISEFDLSVLKHLKLLVLLYSLPIEPVPPQRERIRW